MPASGARVSRAAAGGARRFTIAHWFDDFSAALCARRSRRATLKLALAGVGLTALGRAKTLRAQPAAVAYPPGWNLVAGPAGSTLSGASGSLYTLQPGDAAYEVIPATNTLQACVGYWAYFPSGGSLNAAVGIGLNAACNAPNTRGNWAMIGNPSLAGPATVAGADKLLTYTPAGGYQNGSTIPVGQGAWVISRIGLIVEGPVTSATPGGLGSGNVPPPVQSPPPTQTALTPTQTAPPATGSGCCRTCTSGCPCGNSCITCRDTCHQGAGCAC